MWLSIDQFRHENTTRRYDLLVQIGYWRRVTNYRHTLQHGWLTPGNKKVVGRVGYWMPEPAYPPHIDDHRRK